MAFENGYALSIGIGSYQHVPQANIPISVADAKAVAELLREQSLCGYLPEQVKLLHDAQASRAGILAALDELASQTTPENTVLLYYCGHGDYGTDGDYYLTTYDTQVVQGQIAPGTGINNAELLEKLRAIPAKRLLLLFNACHSGELSPHLGFGGAEKSFGGVSLPQPTAEALLSTGEGRIIITASRPEQKSWIGLGQLSIFSQALVDGLSGQGYVPNNNGYVSAYGLYEHLYFAVKEMAEAEGHPQEPELTVLKGVGPFPVSLYRGATNLGMFDSQASLPPQTATREVSPERSERLFRQKLKSYEATLSGSGVIAQGENATAVHAESGGLAIAGDVGGNVIINNPPPEQKPASQFNITAPGSQIGAMGDNITIQGGLHFHGSSTPLSAPSGPSSPPPSGQQAVSYDLKKVRNLLDDVFSAEELRDFCLDNANFRPVHEQLKEIDRKADILRQMLDRARRKENLLAELLAWAKEANSARYAEDEPYQK